MGRSSWTVGVGPKCSHMCPYKEGSEGDVKTLALKTEVMRPPSRKVGKAGPLVKGRATRSWHRGGPSSLWESAALLVP